MKCGRQQQQITCQIPRKLLEVFVYMQETCQSRFLACFVEIFFYKWEFLENFSLISRDQPNTPMFEKLRLYHHVLCQVGDPIGVKPFSLNCGAHDLCTTTIGWKFPRYQPYQSFEQSLPSIGHTLYNAYGYCSNLKGQVWWYW